MKQNMLHTILHSGPILFYPIARPTCGLVKCFCHTGNVDDAGDDTSDPDFFRDLSIFMLEMMLRL